MVKSRVAPPKYFFMLPLRLKRSIYSNRTISTFGPVLLKIGIYPNTTQLYTYSLAISLHIVYMQIIHVQLRYS